MNKRLPLFLIACFAIAGCAKTDLLYSQADYNNADFNLNYYTEWGKDEDNIKLLPLKSETKIEKNADYSTTKYEVYLGGNMVENCVWIDDKDNEFGYKNNLCNIEKQFAYGITSKLFDGRVWCDLMYQKSRVQLDKSGFAMYFPKSLVSTEFLGFACRGGTDLPNGEEFSHEDLNVNFTWSFYIHLEDGTYNKVSYILNNVKIPVDNGGSTAFVNFLPTFGNNFDELYGAVAMSFEWEANDARLIERNLTDDYTQKEKHHLALMLYEVFIGNSTWY